MITRRQYLKQATLATCGLALAHALPAESATDIDGKHSLKAHAHKRGMLAGCAVSAANLRDDAFTKVLAEQYSLVVPENCMKFGFVHPAADRYDFADGDALVAFAEQHKIKVRGHNFVWHEAIPAWFAGTVNKDNAKKFLTDHILTVGGRYKGKMQSWDVVNEAINVTDGRPDNLRKSPWLDLLGPEYLEIAYRTARQADPKAKLTYNEYGIEDESDNNAAKRDATLALIKRLKAAGAPIDALGIQSHISAGTPRVFGKGLRDLLDQAQSMGLEVYIESRTRRERRRNRGQTTPPRATAWLPTSIAITWNSDPYRSTTRKDRPSPHRCKDRAHLTEWPTRATPERMGPRATRSARSLRNVPLTPPAPRFTNPRPHFSPCATPSTKHRIGKRNSSPPVGLMTASF